MVDKLYTVGIRGQILNWISSFMSDRNMIVKVKNSLSDTRVVDLGVPQGSVLGPLLFILYINELPRCISSGLTTMFADDTTITVSALTPEELLEKMNTVTDEMDAWCQRNKLILNVNKTVCLNFHIKTSRPDLDSPLFSQQTKFLGTIVDPKLKWHNHLNHVCSKLNSAYFAIFQLKSYLDMDGLLSVYYALAYSHISYNIVVWGITSEISRVLVCQKRIIRLLFNLKPRDSCRPYFKKHRILTAPAILILKAVTYVFNNKMLFTRSGDVHPYDTRNTNTLLIPKHRTSFFKQSPTYNFVRLFNKLPIEVKSSLNYSTFKRSVKDFLHVGTFYSLEEFLCDT